MVDAFAEEAYLTFDWPQQAGQRTHQRGLASAVGAKDSNQLALGNFEIGPPHHGCGAVAGGQRADCHQRLLRSYRDGLFAAALRLLAGAQVGFQHGRIGGHLSGRSLCDHGAGVEHDHMVGDAHHQIHIVLDQDHGHAHGRELAQQRTDRRGVFRVQPCRRLIEREHARPDRERAGDFDQPFVDMRERIRGPLQRTPIADEGEQAFSDLGIVAVLAAGEKMRRQPAAPQRDHDIVDDRHRLEELACLIRARDAGARNLIGAQRRNDSIAEPHRSRIRPVEAADDIERCALAGPVRADDACDRTRLRLEGEIAHGAHAAEIHRKIAHRKRLSACAGGEKAADVASLFCKRVALLPGQNARDQPDQARRRKPQHGQHQDRPTNRSRYWPSVASSSGSSTTTKAPTIGPSTRSAPPSITTKRNRID